MCKVGSPGLWEEALWNCGRADYQASTETGPSAEKVPLDIPKMYVPKA